MAGVPAFISQTVLDFGAPESAR